MDAVRFCSLKCAGACPETLTFNGFVTIFEVAKPFKYLHTAQASSSMAVLIIL
jgi:hypothetical protein